MTPINPGKNGRTGIGLAIVAGGVLAGLCDITYAMTAYDVFHTPGVPPERVLQVIASGVLGRTASFAGGLASAALGLALHFTIAVGMAAAYVAVSLAWPGLRRWWAVLGPLYGALLFVVMNTVVVPLSYAKGGWPPGWYFVGDLASHMFGVGFVIAGLARAILGQDRRCYFT